MNILLLFGAAALALSWLLPGHYWPWMTFQQEAAAAFGALLIGAATLSERRVSWPPAAWAAIAAAAIPLLQKVFGLVYFTSDATLAAMYLAGAGACVAAAATLARAQRIDIAGWVLGGLCCAALISVGLSLMQWQNIGIGAFVDGAPPGSRAWANFGQPNNLATALAIGACAILLGHSRNKIGPLVTVVSLAFLGLGMVMTQSRSGYVIVAMLCIAMVVFHRRAALPIRPIMVLTGGGTFAAAVLAWPALNAALMMTEKMGIAERLTTGGIRMIHWQVMRDAILLKPWFGYGWTQAALAQNVAMVNYPATGEVLASSHSIALDLLVWNGIPLGLVMIGLAVWWFVRQLRVCKSPEQLFLLAAVGAIVLHGLLEFPLEYAFFLLPMGLMIGVLEARAPSRGTLTTGRTQFGALFTSLALLSTWVFVEYMRVDTTSRTLRFVVLGIGIDKVNTAPEPDVLLLDHLKAQHRFMVTRAAKNYDENYMQTVRVIAMRHPSAPAMLRHAMAAGLNGHPDEAAAVLARYCKIHMREACDQGRSEWGRLQLIHPELRGIQFTATTETVPGGMRPPLFQGASVEVKPDSQPNTPSNSMKNSAN